MTINLIAVYLIRLIPILFGIGFGICATRQFYENLVYSDKRLKPVMIAVGEYAAMLLLFALSIINLPLPQ